MTRFPNGVDTPSLSVGGGEVTASAADFNALAGKAGTINVVLGRTVVELDGSTGKTACTTNGLSLIAGGNGIAGMTLAAPSVGSVAVIRIVSRSSGNIVVTCAAGVTLNGTNNIATFDAAEETLILMYAGANKWAVVLNVGGVALSTAA